MSAIPYARGPLTHDMRAATKWFREDRLKHPLADRLDIDHFMREAVIGAREYLDVLQACASIELPPIEEPKP